MKRCGLGLVELLIGIVCFLIAAIPIISLFSFNIENSRVLHAKAITLSASQEILQQLVLVRPAEFTEGFFTIDGKARSFPLPTLQGARMLGVTILPGSFSRTIRIHRTGSETVRITVRITSQDVAKADLEIARTVVSSMGGR